MSATAAPSQRLLNRVAIVAGSCQGLERGICLQFHLEGALLICADLRPNGLPGEEPTHEVIQKQGRRAIFKVDVSDSKQVQAMIAQAVEEYGALHMLVKNNAGICGEATAAKPIDEADEDIFDLHMMISVKGPFMGPKYALRQMKKQEPIGRGDRGWIINLSSIVTSAGMRGLHKCHHPSYEIREAH
ncbi:hypothetical protein AJ79_07914 [Helicocarpus griseus UAMH5409]|uniref:3-oxoacyl-[acyl-carrier-protein] reductase n=1 Tax=Helicocarpus griseus UAMH5409 TaxID=1447875 RepID=A0A2B7WXE7_9EURO|nr:hypothetical protein AJ79_07914 [Helicocarpus griseus UAMH5409]